MLNMQYKLRQIHLSKKNKNRQTVKWCSSTGKQFYQVNSFSEEAFTHINATIAVEKFVSVTSGTVISVGLPHAGSGVVRIDPIRFLAGCRTRRLNQG